jgi:hypothetical protein
MNRSIQLLSLAAFLGVAGCSIPFADSQLVAQNECSADSDCEEGSYCAVLGDESACVASSVDLEGLLFEVRPAPGNGKINSSPALITPGPFSAGDGSQVITLDLQVPSYVDVSPGSVFLPCADGEPVPARVTFLPSPGLLGLLQGERYESAATLDEAGNEGFEASVPPGVYDLYLQPDMAAAPGCVAAPPIFLPRQTISKTVGFAVHASSPLLLTGTLKLSQKEDFTEWYLEVVEPFGGQTISQVVQPQQEGIALEVPFQLWFDWTARAELTPILRLRPPEGSGKPVIHWSLDAVALNGIDGDSVPVTLDVSGIDTQPRQVGGQVLHDGEPVSATVTLRSVLIGGSKLNRYETVVETDDAGQFTSHLPPGEYTVIARPHAAGLAVEQDTWDVLKADDCYCGKAIEVPSATTVAGAVTTPSGEPADVEVRLTPAATGDLTYLSKMVATDVQPRPAGTVTQAGAFQVPVDVGLYNLSLLPPAGSGYPWHVRTRVPVTQLESQSAPVTSLGKLALQSPVVVRGRLTDDAGFPLSSATLRAWIPVRSDGPKDVPSAVQIGEVVADVNGEYFLLLPPSIK